MVLVPIGQLFRLPYLIPPWREASWELSLGAVMAVWVAVALWSGAATVGYRGIANRTVYRAAAPSTFWAHLAIRVGFGLVLLGLGTARLLRHA